MYKDNCYTAQIQAHAMSNQTACTIYCSTMNVRIHVGLSLAVIIVI